MFFKKENGMKKDGKLTTAFGLSVAGYKIF
jgi:hypothetical protein